MFNWGKGKETGIGDSSYDEGSPLNGITNELTYQDCLDIYKYWPMGIRVIQALPNFALSVKRKILFKDLPKEFVDRFEQVEQEFDVKNVVKNLCYNIRIFGSSCLYIKSDTENLEDPLTDKEIQKSKYLRFIQATPLITSGSIIDIDPLSLTYLKPVSVKVVNRDVNLTRILWFNNDEPQYLQWNSPSFNYAGRSVFANMVDLIKYWNRSTIALQRIASKAGGIIVKNREGGILNSVTLNSLNKFLDVVRNLSNDGIASIQHNDEIELFSLTGTSEVELIINKFNEMIQLALSDTPTAILLDERLAKGFGNGEEDFKALLLAVENYRETFLNKIYKEIDSIILKRAFTMDFLESMKKQYSTNLKEYSINQLFLKLEDSFTYEWEPLYPESEAQIQDNLGRKLDNLAKLKELGASLSDIEEIINSDSTIYEQEITLEEPEPEEGEEEEDSYVSSLNKVNKPTGDEATE